MVVAIIFLSTFVLGKQESTMTENRTLPMIALVFDDAHRSLPDIYSILKERELIGTAFVPTELIGNYDFHTSWDTIVSLAQSGWEIGAHTKTHPNLRELPPLDAWEEIIGSKRYLVERGIPVTSFAPPFGEMPESLLYDTSQHFETIRMAWGNRVIDANSLEKDRYALPVFDVAHTGTDRESLLRILDKTKPDALLLVVFHKIAKEGEALDQYTIRDEDFRTFADKVRMRKDGNTLRVVTLSDGIRELEKAEAAPFWKKWIETGVER